MVSWLAGVTVVVAGYILLAEVTGRRVEMEMGLRQGLFFIRWHWEGFRILLLL